MKLTLSIYLFYKFGGLGLFHEINFINLLSFSTVYFIIPHHILSIILYKLLLYLNMSGSYFVPFYKKTAVIVYQLLLKINLCGSHVMLILGLIELYFVFIHLYYLYKSLFHRAHNNVTFIL